MTTVTLELPDQIVQRVEQRARTRGMTLSQQVSELLDESTNGNQDSLRAEAIRRMNELFAQVSGFRAEPRFPREELYERGSLR
jgi:macrodomain Ter protein organizer (MatP/YcbG family)